MITRVAIGFAAFVSIAGVAMLLVLAAQKSPTGAFLALMLFGIGRAGRISLKIHGGR